MNILMVTSEAVPFSKSGGLADVAGALSSALAKIDNKVYILMPAYGFIKLDEFSQSIATFNIEINSQNEKVEILKKELNNVTYLALKHPWFTMRKGIYGDTSFTPYSDNFARYLLLSKAALPLCKALNFKVDIIHSHDWTVGFTPYFLKINTDPFFKKTKSVFTIHNLAYQGDFTRIDSLAANVKITKKMFTSRGPEKRINMMKTALEYADFITTVSPTYSKEIQEKELGCNLEHILHKRSAELFGIINGIDYQEWNSETDENFTSHYNSNNFSGKAKLKEEIQKEFNLEVNPNIPLIGMISRLAEQKGFNELLNNDCALEQIIKNNKVQFIIIGTGDTIIENKLKYLGEKYPNVSVNILFSNRAAHRVEGGCDFFFMPSKYEPCGLNQLYSLRYGTLPIARKTGGLADTIIDIDEHPKTGTGFLFSELKSHAIIEVIKRAINLYYTDEKTIAQMKKRSMETDFTWNKSAQSYMKIYLRGIL